MMPGNVGKMPSQYQSTSKCFIVAVASLHRTIPFATTSNPKCSLVSNATDFLSRVDCLLSGAYMNGVVLIRRIISSSMRFSLIAVSIPMTCGNAHHLSRELGQMTTRFLPIAKRIRSLQFTFPHLSFFLPYAWVC